MAIWCDRKSCEFRDINNGEIIDTPDAIGRGYCTAFCEEIHINSKGKCTNFIKKGIAPKGNPELKETYDKALNELTNYK